MNAGVCSKIVEKNFNGDLFDEKIRMYLLKVQKKLCYASAIYWRVLAIYSISWALKNVILSLRTVQPTAPVKEFRLSRPRPGQCDRFNGTKLEKRV